MPNLTASQVNRAGQRIRRHVRGDGENPEQLYAALDTLVAFRALPAGPLQTATMGLRSTVNSEGMPVQVSQRLKRVPTIIDKLVREPTLALSRMHDIGGCRAVLPSIAGIRAVQSRLEARRRHLGPSSRPLFGLGPGPLRSPSVFMRGGVRHCVA